MSTSNSLNFCCIYVKMKELNEKTTEQIIKAVLNLLQSIQGLYILTLYS